MPNPTPADPDSHHQQYRRAASAARLQQILDHLDRLIDRRRLLPPIHTGPARRLIAEAGALAGQPGESLRRRARPADLLVETMKSLHALSARKAPARKALRPISPKTYPRGPRRA